MPQIYPITYAPNLDTAWSQMPGGCSLLSQFLPTIRGTYGSVGTGSYLALSTTNGFPIIAYMFRKVDGTMRFLTFQATTIDEYDNAATRTNRATGLTTGTGWSAAANGNAIVAVNYTNASLVSTGAGFAALGGGSPKARIVLAQAGFMMMLDYDDGVNQYADGWWCSAIGNYASWTASAATQAANGRLLDTPGPIRAAIPQRDTVVAFKDNSMYVGQYVGPPIIWAWRLVSNRIGCIAREGVAEYNGTLYFLHSSGVYSFDGSQIQNIGQGVHKYLLYRAGYAITGSQTVGVTAGDITQTQTLVDDINGTILFAPECTGATKSRLAWFGYNAFTQKWGLFCPPTGTTTTGDACVVKATIADIQSFKADTTSRGLIIVNDGVPAYTARSIKYPNATDSSNVNTALATPSLQTGYIGSTDMSFRSTRIQWRCLETDPTAIASVTGAGYTTEDGNNQQAPVIGAINTALDVGDIVIDAKYRLIGLSWTLGKLVELAGIGIEQANKPSRP